MKSFYKFLVKTETINSSPLIAHSPLKHSKKIQVPFSKDEIGALLDSDFFKSDYKGVLQKTIISFFYFTGVRRIELINLKTSDINMNSYTIRITGKRNKERIIPMLPKLKESINEYLKIKSQEFNNVISDYLFISKSGIQLSENMSIERSTNILSLFLQKLKKLLMY